MNNKNKKSVKFQGDMLNFCDIIQVYVFTTNHHLNTKILLKPGMPLQLNGYCKLLFSECPTGVFYGCIFSRLMLQPAPEIYLSKANYAKRDFSHKNVEYFKAECNLQAICINDG